MAPWARATRWIAHARCYARRGCSTRCCRLAAAASSRWVGAATDGWSTSSRRCVRQPIATVLLRNAAIGTSGAGEQFVIKVGQRYGHVIDRRTGWPAPGTLSASVVASGAARADALSTAFLVGGPDLARRYCDTHPACSRSSRPTMDPNGRLSPAVARQPGSPATEEKRPMMTTPRLSPLQQVSLVILRPLVGWHFLYEGYTKLLHPAWSQAARPFRHGRRPRT